MCPALSNPNSRRLLRDISAPFQDLVLHPPEPALVLARGKGQVSAAINVLGYRRLQIQASNQNHESMHAGPQKKNRWLLARPMEAGSRQTEQAFAGKNTRAEIYRHVHFALAMLHARHVQAKLGCRTLASEWRTQPLRPLRTGSLDWLSQHLGILQG